MFTQMSQDTRLPLLTDCRAVVTGASSGIGAATARMLAAENAAVAAIARRWPQLGALAADDARIAPVQADVTDSAQLQDAALQIGGVDLLVVAAGILLPGPLTVPAALDDWHRSVEVNVTGVLNTVAAFLPALLHSAATIGHADLVLVSSIAAHQRAASYTVHGAVKAAVTALAEGWRLDLLGSGVRVTTVEPGLTATELLDHIPRDEDREALRAVGEAVGPLRPSDVAEAIVYAVTRPPGVNLASIVIMPTLQP